MARPASRSIIRRLLPALAIVLFAAVAAAGLVRVPVFDALDRLAYDTQLRWREAPLDERIVIVDIDERSLAEQGRWPWTRERIAKLTRELTDGAGAAVVGFDVVFAEHERSEAGDGRLAQALRDKPVLLGYYFSSDRGGQRSGVLPAPVFVAGSLPPGIAVTHWDGYGANIAPFAHAARDAGFFNPVIDPDGVVRSMPMLAEFDGQLYQALSLALLREYLGEGVLSVGVDQLDVIGKRGRVSIPLSEGLSALAPFAGRLDNGQPGLPFRLVSATDVIEGRAPASLFAGRIVLVGTTAPGLSDLRAAPVGQTYPGVAIHATLISGALDGRIDARPPEARVLAALLTLVVGGVLAFAVLGLGPLSISLVSVGAALALVGVHALVLEKLQFVLPVSAAVAMVPALGLYGLAVGFIIEGRARRAVINLFGEYVSPELVRKMAADPMNYDIDNGEQRELTILFADIRGFTRIAETMQPNELREYLNEFLTGMTEIVHRHGGTVDKYIGDAVMAFWGAPIADADHADHAVAAAIDMQKAASEMSYRFTVRGMPALSIGIGINTGEVTVGDMGSKLRRSYTVIGDAVNLSARLEALTKRYGVPVLVGETTAARCILRRFESMGTAAVDGRHGEIEIFVPREFADQVRRPEASTVDTGDRNEIQSARV